MLNWKLHITFKEFEQCHPSAYSIHRKSSSFEKCTIHSDPQKQSHFNLFEGKQCKQKLSILYILLFF